MTHVLVIEPEESSLHQIVSLLEQQGLPSLAATTASQGMEIAHEKQPQVILCATTIPESSGYEVLQTLRQQESTATIPFIFLTAGPDRNSIEQWAGLGITNYVTKPVNRAELLGSIHASLIHIQPNPDLEKPSASFLCANLINSEMESRYQNWFIALEVSSQKFFLGSTMQEAHEAASQVFPGSVFYYRQIGVTKPSPIAEPAKEHYVLLVKQADSEQSFMLQEEAYSIGRTPSCSIFLDNPKISRIQAILQRHPSGGYQIIDGDGTGNRSTNGTYINGIKIERRLLQDGDVILLGRSEVSIRFYEPVKPAEGGDPFQDIPATTTILDDDGSTTELG
ncbi:MAG: FHA domain-containing protein [Cyanobacteriota bacterium]|nr:FHA domain-containing protein [Cyanobacteriota bacterium]